MENIFQDETKIKFYAQVQSNLCSLEPNCSDYEIDHLFNQIPQEYLIQKDNLMVICQLIAAYAHKKFNMFKYNAIRLLKRIIPYLNTHLQDESSFLWNIFGVLYDIKLILYRENLISIEQIIQSVIKNNSPLTAAYFLPEIISAKPEIFEKDIKYRIQLPYSIDKIEEFKNEREKHFKWLLECQSNFNDPIYDEIETDKLRLSLKRDDVGSFQQIVSNTNLSLDETINENIHDQFVNETIELPIILYAVVYNAVNIIKFLLLKDVEIPFNTTYFVINNGNYELIHLFESKKKEVFKFDALRSSVTSWNFEMTEYVLNNYSNYEYLQKNDSNINPALIRANVYALLNNINSNFVFFESILLPYLRNNPKFVEDNIYQLIHVTIGDMTSFFTKEFCKYPNIDVNHFCEDFGSSFVGQAINVDNSNAVEFFISNPKYKFDKVRTDGPDPFVEACSSFSCMKIIKLLDSNKNSVENWRIENDRKFAFNKAMHVKNFYAVQFIFEKYPNIEYYLSEFLYLMFALLKEKSLFLLKIILKFYLEKSHFQSYTCIESLIKDECSDYKDLKEELFVDLKQIYDEITSSYK